MTEDDIVAVYLNYIEKNFPKMSVARLAEALDLTESQIEQLIDLMSWKHFRIASGVKKAVAEDLKPACVILPFMKLTNND